MTEPVDRPTRTSVPELPWGVTDTVRSSWPSPPQEDLLRAALLPDERALSAWDRIRPSLAAAALDGATLAILPHLHRNLRRLGVSDPLLDLFKGVHRHTWAHNQVLLSRVMPLLDRLERAGMPTMLLKGAALIAGRRQDAGMRQLGDIDVLVPTGCFPDAWTVLRELGMKSQYGEPDWFITSYAPRFKNSWNLTNESGAELDLHWHALQGSRHTSADDEFWTAAEAIELHGVATRGLAPADDLLVTILHGLRWNPVPPYRWVLDASLLVRGLSGPVDFDRLVRQARRHRMTAAVRAGLAYASRLADLPMPRATLRALAGPAPLQRAELHALARPKRNRSEREVAALRHLDHVRANTPPGTRLTPLMHLRLAMDRLGVANVHELRHVPPGGFPGVGRPAAENSTPVGTGRCDPPVRAWGETFHLGDPDTARAHCLYGLWVGEGFGSWIAGREARLAFALPRPAATSGVALDLVAGALGGSPQRLRIWVDDTLLAEVIFEADDPGPRLVSMTLPAADTVVAAAAAAAAARPSGRLEIVFEVPDAITPAQLGIHDDDRLLGVYLGEMSLRAVAGDRREVDQPDAARVASPTSSTG